VSRKITHRLQFPLAGLDRGLGFQAQGPYTTFDAQNVVPDATFFGRRRGGQRPGLQRAWKPGSSSRTQTLDKITVKTENESFDFWQDSFQYTSFPSYWTSTDNAIGGVNSTAPTIRDGTITADKGDATEQKVLLYGARSDHKSPATSEAYKLEMEIAPYNNAHHGTYSIYFRLDGSPSVTSDANAMEARMSITSTGTVSVQLYKQNSTLGSAFTATDTVCTGGIFGVKVTKGGTNDTIEVFWRGESLGSTSSSTGTTTDRGFGFGLKATTANGRCIVHRVRLQYVTSAAKELLRPRKVQVLNGEIYRETTFFDELTAAGQNRRLANNRPILMADRGQKGYFADSGIVAYGTDGVISSNTFDSATFTDWTTVLSSSVGTDTYFGNFVVHVTAPEQNAGVYPINSLASGSLGITAGDATGLSFRIERGPKIYDPKANTLTLLTASNGTCPAGCTLIARYRDRIILAGDPLDPNELYGSRVGDPLDWDFTDDDAGSAFKASAADAGVPGDAITALMTRSDDHLFIGCRSSLYIMRGDPPGGGRIDLVSERMGVLSARSWCHGPAGEVVWLSRFGIWMTSPKCLECQPESVSLEKLPRELVDIDPNLVEVTMEYSQRERGILISLTPLATVGGVRHWFLDWESRGLFPVVFGDTGSYPTAMRYFDCADSEDSALYVAGADGSLRRFVWHAANDDAAAISSYVYYGPINLASADDQDGTILDIKATLANDSGPVDWLILTGQNAESAARSTATEPNGSFAGGGKQSTILPKRRGGAYVLKLSGTAGRRWAVDSITATHKLLGRSRLT
jgi:hypothetical protein